MNKICFLLFSLIFLYGGSATAQNKKRKRKKDIETAVNVAYSYKGTPYWYGGTKKSGIDCSALIQNSFSKAGYKVPRTSIEQSQYGKKVGWTRLRKGDIVFFRFKKNGKKWNHSGLITSVKKGKIHFIHSSSLKGVIVSDLNADYYRKSVKVIRRFIK